MVGAVEFENADKRTFNDLQAPDGTVRALTTQSARKQSADRAHTLWDWASFAPSLRFVNE